MGNVTYSAAQLYIKGFQAKMIVDIILNRSPTCNMFSNILDINVSNTVI